MNSSGIPMTSSLTITPNYNQWLHQVFRNSTFLLIKHLHNNYLVYKIWCEMHLKYNFVNQGHLWHRCFYDLIISYLYDQLLYYQPAILVLCKQQIVIIIFDNFSFNSLIELSFKDVLTYIELIWFVSQTFVANPIIYYF